jgi:hypothetical protein
MLIKKQDIIECLYRRETTSFLIQNCFQMLIPCLTMFFFILQIVHMYIILYTATLIPIYSEFKNILFKKILIPRCIYIIVHIDIAA